LKFNDAPSGSTLDSEFYTDVRASYRMPFLDDDLTHPDTLGLAVLLAVLLEVEQDRALGQRLAGEGNRAAVAQPVEVDRSAEASAQVVLDGGVHGLARHGAGQHDRGVHVLEERTQRVARRSSTVGPSGRVTDLG